MLKEIRFSDHAKLKIDLLRDRNVAVSEVFTIDVVRSPDKLEVAEEDKRVAQKRLNEKLVLRVVYREYESFILVITLYPGKRSRYEKD
ncbi:MAG: DUF4258 domain-containing protein [Leptolyngbya sp.]|nr:MAG: DUF4258 domain-containing protein [Leptolyngbya sp.]